MSEIELVNFADYNTSKLLRELGFDEPCFGVYSLNNEFSYSHDAHQLYRPKNSQLFYSTAPLWQQIESFLWDKYLIQVRETSMEIGSGWYSKFIICSNSDIQEAFKQGMGMEYYDSPITSKIEGIKKVIRWLSVVKHIETLIKK